MRQKENLETFLESLLLSEDQFKTDAGGHTHTSLPPLSHIQRSVHSVNNTAQNVTIVFKFAFPGKFLQNNRNVRDYYYYYYYYDF